MNPPTFHAPESTAPSLSIGYLVRLVTRRASLLASLLAATMLLALVYLHFATRYYRSTAAIQVQEQEQRAFRPDDHGGEDNDLKADDALKTIEQNLQSPALFLRVATDPAIVNDPRLFQGVSKHPLTVTQLADFIQSNTRAQLRHGTRLIDVSVDHPIPGMAQKLCQAVVQDYIIQSQEISMGVSTQAEGLLSGDSNGMKAKLQQSEDALATYREVLMLKERISDQQRILDALSQRYRAKHPTMIQARTLMQSLIADFDADVRKIRVDSRERPYWSQQDSILEKLTPQDRVETELQMVAARTSVLEGEVATERTLFNNVLRQTSEASISAGAAPSAVMIRDSASLPDRPVRPKKSVILVLALAAGIGLGIGCLVLFELLDSSFKTPEEVEQFLGLTVLGTVPEIHRAEGGPDGTSAKRGRLPQSLVLASDPGGVAAESFRTMRASLSLLGKREERRTFLFTSALSGEGKTFISGNYAVSLAQQGVKTLLMETDLRCPSLHTLFDLTNQVGLVDHVARGISLEDCVHQDVMPDLDVLTSGTKCPNPAEFLAGRGFRDTLKEVLTRYETVVIDCSPINLVSDSLMILPYVQSVVLVVRANHTPRKDARHALNTLTRAGVPPVGVVINAVPDWTRSLYYTHPGRYAGGDKYYQAYSTARS